MSIKFNVDLKWALWSADEGHWEQYAPQALEALKELQPNYQSVIVYTAPRKEIRHGWANIYRVKSGKYCAYGKFTCEWDSAAELMDTFGLNPDDDAAFDTFVETLPFTTDGEPGVSREFDVEAPTLGELLMWIDEEEAALIIQSSTAWHEIEEMYSKERIDLWTEQAKVLHEITVREEHGNN